MIFDRIYGTSYRSFVWIGFSISCVIVLLYYRSHTDTLTRCQANEQYLNNIIQRVYYESPQSTLQGTSRREDKLSESDTPVERQVEVVKEPENSDQETKNPTKQTPISTERPPLSTETSQQCYPDRYVMFLKTHKTGSSTITNLLNRYADKYNLSVLLPNAQGYYSFDWPNKFRLSSALNVFQGRPNFLANHARYSRRSLNVLFPRNSSKYISILRNPVSQWESTFHYMSFPFILSITHMNDPLSFFLDNPPSYDNIKQIANRYPSAYLIRNPLFFDLGMDHRDYENTTVIKRAIKTIDDDFDLVLVMEHFDESLTLLRRRLCWDIDDVVYFKMNERLNQHKHKSLSQEQIEKVKRWNKADMVLYNYFVEKFWREIAKEGAHFYEEVQELKRRRKMYYDMCIEKEAVEEAYSSVFVKGYKMRSNLTLDSAKFCTRMLRNELHYQDYFRSKTAKWVASFEGGNIENFADTHNEANVFVGDSHVPYSGYKYGEKHLKKSNVKQRSYATKQQQRSLQTQKTSQSKSRVENNTGERVVSSEKNEVPGKIVDELEVARQRLRSSQLFNSKQKETSHRKSKHVTR